MSSVRYERIYYMFSITLRVLNTVVHSNVRLLIPVLFACFFCLCFWSADFVLLSDLLFIQGFYCCTCILSHLDFGTCNTIQPHGTTVHIWIKFIQGTFFQRIILCILHTVPFCIALNDKKRRIFNKIYCFWTPAFYTRMWIFPNLLQQSYKHTTA